MNFVRSTDYPKVANLTDSECKTFFYKSNFIPIFQLLSQYSKNMYYLEIVKPKNGVISLNYNKLYAL